MDLCEFKDNMVYRELQNRDFSRLCLKGVGDGVLDFSTLYLEDVGFLVLVLSHGPNLALISGSKMTTSIHNI